MTAQPGCMADRDLMISLCAAANQCEIDSLFSELFGRYHPRVVSWCSRITRDCEWAADLAQEVMWKAYRNRESFRGDARLSTWLYAIARNHCLTALKRRGARGMFQERAISPRLRDHSVTPQDVAAERGELYGFLGRLMTRTLEPLEARVIALHYGFEVPLGEITRDLHLVNPSGAKAYIVNGRRKLHGTLRRRGWQDSLSTKKLKAA